MIVSPVNPASFNIRAWPRPAPKKNNVIFFDAKPAWTKKLWIYDFRTNVHMTLKTKRLIKSDFDEFIELYSAEDWSKRKAKWSEDPSASVGMTKGGRWRAFSYEELIARDKTNLDIFWLKDDSLEDTENLPAPEILAQEIIEQLQAALDEFRTVEEILVANDD